MSYRGRLVGLAIATHALAGPPGDDIAKAA
jgi:hypothetical protein